MSFNVLKSFLLILSTISLTSIINCQQYLDDFCTIRSSGNGGKCILLQNCPKAVQDLQQKQIFPQQCGFQGTQPIVCCDTSATTLTATTTTTRRTTTTSTTSPVFDKMENAGEKSRKKCEEYSEYVYETRSSAVLLANRKPIRVDKCASKAVELIVGGEKAESREFPHMALVGFGSSSNEIQWKCGGSLISERFVLTAAHCLYTTAFGYANYVRLGDLNIERTDDDARPQEIQVSKQIFHPDYSAPSAYNDIGLLQLKNSATLNIYVRPACLFTSSSITSKRAIATGWGRTGYSKGSSSDLLKVILEQFSYDKCRSTYRNAALKLKNGIQEDSQTCWGSESEEKDTCQGDSGGPIQVNSKVYCMYDIVGVTSLGKSCGVVNIPGVYTKVSKYIGWIENIVWS